MSVLPIILGIGYIHYTSVEEYPLPYDPVIPVHLQEKVAMQKLPTDKPKGVPIQLHRGGKALSYKQTRKTITTILKELPNLQVGDHFTDLIMETMIVETNLGAASYDHAHNTYHNYGLGQFTHRSARDTFNWCKKNHPDSHEVMMKYYDKRLSFLDNVSYNVPFSIALISQYYLQRTNGKVNRTHLSTLEQRSYVWDRVYNTALGSGSPDIYTSRVRTYYRKQSK